VAVGTLGYEAEVWVMENFLPKSGELQKPDVASRSR